MGRNILIVIAAVVLIAIIVMLIVIGVGKKTPTPTTPVNEENFVEQSGEASGTGANGQQSGSATPTQTAPAESAAQSGVQTGTTNPAQSTYPLGDFSEGVEQWKDTTPPAQATTGSEPSATTTPVQTTPAVEPTTSTQKTLTYEDYLQMSRAEQQEYFKSYEKVDDFYLWLDNAQAEHKKQHPEATGNGSIDIGDYIP